MARRTCRKGDEDEEAVTDVEQLLADPIVGVCVLHAPADESQRRVVQVRNALGYMHVQDSLHGRHAHGLAALLAVLLVREE